MSIHSHAFGRVTLTGDDAQKFKKQVSHGQPKKAAVETLKRGVKLSREFQQKGRIVLAVKLAKPARGGK